MNHSHDMVFYRALLPGDLVFVPKHEHFAPEGKVMLIASVVGLSNETIRVGYFRNVKPHENNVELVHVVYARRDVAPLHACVLRNGTLLRRLE